MARLFFSLAFVIIVFVFISVHISNKIADHTRLADKINNETKRAYTGAKIILDKYYQAIDGDKKALTKTFNQVRDIDSFLPIELIEFNNLLLEKNEKEILKSEKIFVASYEEEEVYILLDNSTYVVKFGPNNPPIWLEEFETYFEIFIYAGLSLTALLWIGLLQSRLNRLNKAAKELGDGNLNARVSENFFHTIGIINKTFNGMASRIQKLILGHKQLVNAVAHELRSPVARIRLQLEMLEQTDHTTAQGKYITGIDEDLNDLDDLVDELLTYARMERDGLHPEITEIDIAGATRCLIQQLNLETDKTITTHTPETLIASVDKKMFLRAVSNLIRNAICHAKTLIAISISETKTHIVITIADDGDGIEKKDRKKIFEPFVRLDTSRTRDTGGYGLGLAIVQQIINSHHGNITVGSSSYGGAQFTVQLPKQPEKL